MSGKNFNAFTALNEESDNSDNENQLNIVDKYERKNNSTVKLNTNTNNNTNTNINTKNNNIKNNNTNVNTNKFEEEVMSKFYGKKIVYGKTQKQNNYQSNNTNFNNHSSSFNFNSNPNHNHTNTNSNASFNTNSNPNPSSNLNLTNSNSNSTNNSNPANFNSNSNPANFNSNSNSNPANFNSNNEFIKVVNKKKDIKMTAECKYKNIEYNLDDIKMHDYFKILAHHNDDKSWDYNSYYNITCLKTWGDMATFFNTILIAKGECNYTDFDLFVMKNEISPMWEDKENRSGSICSIKIDSLTDGYNIFKNLVLHMANNTLLKFNPSTWNNVNGISFSSKKLDNTAETYCIIVKIWFKINVLNYPSIDKILNDDINQQVGKYSIKIKPIKPEY
jgi:hypothetical protein